MKSETVENIHKITHQTEHHRWQNRVRWQVAVLYLFLLIAAFLFGFMMYSRPVRGAHIGSATINRLGDVVEWSAGAEKVTGINEMAMLHANVFSVLPREQRHEAQRLFERAVDRTHGYKLPALNYQSGDKIVRVSFAPIDEHSWQTTFKR